MSNKLKIAIMSSLFLMASGLATSIIIQINQPIDAMRLRQESSKAKASAPTASQPEPTAATTPLIHVPEKQKTSPPRSTKVALNPAELPVEYNTSITLGEALPVTSPESEGITSITQVKLPATALEWTEKGYRPRMGDIFTIKVKENLQYQLKIDAMQMDESGLSVSGVLVGQGVMGSGGIISVGDKMSITLHDFLQRRLYQLAYDFELLEYTLTEIDQSKIPPGIK